MDNEYVVGTIGTAAGVVGTATQTNEVLRTISLIITIVGAIITYIVVPLISWYKKAKTDGKINAEELKDAAKTLKEGLDKTTQSIKGSQTENEDKREEIEKKGGDNNG